MDRREKIKWIIWIFVIAALTIALILTLEISLLILNTPKLTLFYIEILKVAYQFTFIVVIGAGISWLLSEYRRAQEQDEARRDLYRKFLKNFLFAYNSSKRIRRILRARALSADESTIKVEPYNEQMLALIDVQLRFEYLKKEVENTDLFLSARDMALDLYSIESCLNYVITEYEKTYRIMDTSFPISDLKYLKDFVARPKNSKYFGQMFFDPADRVLDIMLELLTKDNVKINYSNDIDDLAADLKDKDISIRLRAAIKLGNLETQDPKVDHLIEALTDDSAYVRLKAAEALGKIKDARAREPLDQLKNKANEYPIVKKEARKAIEKIDEKIKPYE